MDISLKRVDTLRGAYPHFRPEIRCCALERGRSISFTRYKVSPPRITYPMALDRQAVERALAGMLPYVNYLRSIQGPIAHPILEGYQTRGYRFSLESTLDRVPTALMYSDRVVLRVPQGVAPDAYEVQRTAWYALKQVVGQEAKSYLPPLVRQLASRCGVGYRSITVKDMYSRWGSCSCDKRLNFSIYLMLWPEEYIEGVILHELTHLSVMDHGPRFWQLFSRYLGQDARAFTMRMKAHELEIPQIF